MYSITTLLRAHFWVHFEIDYCFLVEAKESQGVNDLRSRLAFYVLFGGSFGNGNANESQLSTLRQHI